MGSSGEEVELVKRLSRGDESALGSLYDRFSKPIYSMVFHILRDESAAEDIVRDVFVALWQNATNLEQIGPPWLEELQSASALLARSAPQIDPPPELRQIVLAQVIHQKASSVPSVPNRTKGRKSSFLPWAMAGGFAIFAGILWSNNQRLIQDSRELTSQRQVAEGLYRELAALRQALEANEAASSGLRKQIASLEQSNALTGLSVTTLASATDPARFASVVWDQSSQEGILHVRRLPAAESGTDYQLWVTNPDLAAPVSAGVFSVEADGTATVRFAPSQPVPDATNFSVTLEETGGSPVPQGPVILAN